MPPDKQMLIAKESFNGALPDGSEFVAVADKTRIWSTHPAARKWAKFFTIIEVTDSYREEPPVQVITMPEVRAK